MKTKLTMIYWKSEKFWLGKLLEHPEIMTQGESLEELEENILVITDLGDLISSCSSWLKIKGLNHEEHEGALT